MISRRGLLAAGASALAFAARAQGVTSLKTVAAAKGLVFGSAAASYELKDADFAPLLLAQAAQMVPEYEMKRDALEIQPGVYDLAALD